MDLHIKFKVTVLGVRRLRI